MSAIVTPDSHPIETRVLMPEEQNESQQLTSVQNKFIKNVFMTCIGVMSLSGVGIFTACVLLDSTDYRFNAITSVGVSNMFFSATMICFARCLPKVFHELNQERR